MTTIATIKGNITTMEVEAIVNASNPQLTPGGGVSGAIHAGGGPAIAAEGREITRERGWLPTGEAVITTAGRLTARHVIHAVGPVWGHVGETEAIRLLGNSYRNSLEVAVANSCRTVAFPNISTGVYGFPKRLAAETAIAAVGEWTEANPDALGEIIFVCFDDENYGIYTELLGDH